MEANCTIVDGGVVDLLPTLIIRDEIGGTHLAAISLFGFPQAVTITPGGLVYVAIEPTAKPSANVSAVRSRSPSRVEALSRNTLTSLNGRF